LKIEKDPNSERAQLNKYVHFITRFNVHDQSLQLESRLTVVAQKVMKELAEKVLRLVELLWLSSGLTA
jgi:hypothetical protein